MTLKQQAVSGVKWNGISLGIVTILQFVTLTVLARLLSPEEFGLIAMVMVMTGFAQAYADMGISNAIIYRQDTTSLQLSSLYWLNIFAGIVVFVIFLASTPLIILFYREPRLEQLIFFASFTFLITPLGQQFQILLQKELKFNTLSIIEIISSVAGTVIAVGSAIAGQGVFSLVWGQLGNAILKAVLLFIVGWRKWRPQFHFNKNELKGYVGFGFYQMGERSINYFNSRVDQLLIGFFLGAQTLGYYNLAFNLVIQPVVKINPILTRVAFPVFARVQNDADRLKKGYLMTVKIISMVNFPILCGFAAIAPVLVPVIFGKQWLPAIPLVQILSFVALIRAASNPIGSLLLAKGMAGLSFKWNLALLVSQVVGVYLGAQIAGAVGIAIGLLILQIIYFYFNYSVLVYRTIGNCAKEYMGSIIPAIILSSIMAVVVILTSSLSREPTQLILAGQVVGGFFLYVCLAFLFQRQQLHTMKDMVFGKR